MGSLQVLFCFVPFYTCPLCYFIFFISPHRYHLHDPSNFGLDLDLYFSTRVDLIRVILLFINSKISLLNRPQQAWFQKIFELSSNLTYEHLYLNILKLKI
ncbi:hypothetical protein ES332_A09G273300v1 [Gossypium tomentosum]|uniref:Uncharacterized protein n=1 Tax=Gossypium tomentosum TaxID=34277 RepID=A0A5D2P827_GOSTO|nr:hypothetical protein ES332_A09G273300v1 [Gossypium tomentosum]